MDIDSAFQVECIDSGALLYNESDNKYEPMEINLSHVEGILFSCPKCDKQFDNGVSLQNHMNFYHRTTHPCPSCPEIFDNRRALANHKKANHTTDKESNLEHPKTTLAIDHHKQTGTIGNHFTCQYCGSQFEFISYLTRHLRNCDKNLYHKTTHPCPNCPEIFDHWRALANHKKANHTKDKESNLELPKTILAVDPQKQTGATGNPFICQYCGSQFEFISYLTHHLRNCDKNIHTCPDCHKVFISKPRLLNHAKIHRKETFSCVTCKKELRTKGGLEHHIKTNCSALRHCKICGESYTGLSHHKLKHMTDGSNACWECEEKFDDQESLDSHIKQAHPSHFTCSFCNVIFVSQSMLQTHTKRTHHPEISFCDQCGKEFRTLSGLKEHVATSHRTTFDCPECSKSFSSNDLLRSHKHLEHKGEGSFLCDLCPRILKTKGIFYKPYFKPIKSFDNFLM